MVVFDHLLFPVTELLGVDRFLLHEPDSPLPGSLLDVFCRLWEQVAKLLDLLLLHTHEQDVGKLLLMFVVVQGLLVSLVNQVGFEVEEDLEVAEVGVLGEVQDRFLFVNSSLLVVTNFIVISLIVVHVDQSLSDEEHLLDVGLVADHDLAWDVDPAEHVDDQVVGEASLALLEEVVEGLLEVSEGPSALDEFSLHLGSDLLVELELLDDQVEIVQEGLLDVLSDVVVKGWLDVVWLVRLLDFLNPHVKGVELLLDKVIEVVLGVEDAVDGAHQEGEEGQTQELQDDGEDVLVRC